MTDSHGWEVLDMNKISVYLADIKNTIITTQHTMEQKMDTLSERMNTIEASVNDIHKTMQTNYQQYERNKLLYLEILERLSITNSEVKPLLDQLNKNSKDIQQRLSNPFIPSSRVYNRFWRTSMIPNSTFNNTISPSLLVTETETDTLQPQFLIEELDI